MPSPIIKLQDITKVFPGVVALDKVSLNINQGECHGLVGENGAGKSTLGKIIAGIYKYDDGSMKIKNNPVKFSGPYDASAYGIGIVHQELLFCENMTVAENLCLGRFPNQASFVSYKEMEQLCREWLSWTDVDIEPQNILGHLTVGRQQIVQIAAAVSRGAKIIIFDEPTSSLSQHESNRLFQLIEKLKEKNTTIIYISHRLEELFQLCDTISVLRDGQHINTGNVKDYTKDSLIEQMIGRPLQAYFPKHLHSQKGDEVLRVDQLSSPAKFQNISFSLNKGEVLGLGGLVGAGRTEIVQALFGLDPKSEGCIFVNGQSKSIKSPSDAMKLGIGLIPEDRKRHGLAFNLNACENISLPILKKLSKFFWIDRKQENEVAHDYFQKLKVKAPNIYAETLGLSGGNQQKLVLAKWLAAGCRILFIDEPTKGIDVGAKSEIHGLIDELSEKGVALLLISSDMPELINLSTRIIVLHEGKIAGELIRDEFDQDRLMRMMSGDS